MVGVDDRLGPRALASRGRSPLRTPPEDVRLETPMRSKSRTYTDIADVGLTHLERILWAEPGITKQGLGIFTPADWILPHVTGRVLSLVRCPSGTSAKCFFAKHPWSGLSDVVQRIGVGETQPMLAIDGLAGLMSFVQAGVVEIHPWGCRADHLEQPDRDLDPGEDAPWEAVIEAAKELRDRLETCSLKSFVGQQGTPRRGSGRAARRLGQSEIAHRLGRAGNGERRARPLCRHRCEACPMWTHFHRHLAQRPRCDSCGRVFDPRIAASIRLDAPRLE